MLLSQRVQADLCQIHVLACRLLKRSVRITARGRIPLNSRMNSSDSKGDDIRSRLQVVCSNGISSSASPSTASPTPQSPQNAAPPTHLGDLISHRETNITLPGDFSPLQRIILTANGNLQRIIRPSMQSIGHLLKENHWLQKIKVEPARIHFRCHIMSDETGDAAFMFLEYRSSYYNSPVSIQVIRNECFREGSSIRFERVVTLSCLNQVFCMATSEIKVSEMSLISLIEDKGVGIGQLFRYLNLLPCFKLLQLGRKEQQPPLLPWEERSVVSNGAGTNESDSQSSPCVHLIQANAMFEVDFWRLYSLSADGIEFLIREEFPENLFTLDNLKLK